MPGVITPATFISLIRYAQNIGLILGLGDEKELGNKLEKFATGLSDFFNKVFEYIPYFPDLDVRFRLVVLSWFIPVALNCLLIWFTRSAVANLLYIITLICCFGFFYEVSFNVYAHKAETGTYVLIPLAIIGWLGVIAYEFYQWRKHRHLKGDTLISIIDKVINYYVEGVIPNRSNEGRTLEDLDGLLGQRRESLVPHPVVPSPFNLGVIGALLLGGLFVILYGAGVIGRKEQRPNIVVGGILIGIVGLLMLIIIAVTVLIIVPDFRETFRDVMLVVRRLCLKVWLLLLDCLYIPVCQAIVDVLFIKKFSCDVGHYLHWERHAPSLFKQWYDSAINCTVCSYSANWPDDPDYCSRACSEPGYYELHNNLSQQLVFGRDVMGMTGPLIIYAALAIVIGQPIWWAYLISGNRDLAWSVPCYGETAKAKWAWLSEKLASPGVFLFYQFKFSTAFWGFFLPISKLVAVVVTQVITLTTHEKLSWLLLFIYIAIAFLNCFFLPYRFKFNNVFDIVCGVANALLTFFQVLRAHGVSINDNAATVCTIIIILVPLLALAYGFFCRGGVESVPQPGERVVYDENGKECKAVDEVWSEERDIVWLLPIWNAVENEGTDSVRNPDLVETALVSQKELITITSEFVTGKLTECQEKVDAICDAYSTQHVAMVMKLVSGIASACAGWLFGGVAGYHEVAHDPNC
jgi:hypothetical protein